MVIELIFAALILATSTLSSEQHEAAPKIAIPRLPPTAFPELPQSVVRGLTKRGCTIPQAYLQTAPHNVIRGSFARNDQTDWAILCSAGGVTRILVFWKGSDETVSALASTNDDITQENGRYLRAILPVSSDRIKSYHDAFGGPKPPPIDHEGIDDCLGEKVSYVRYFYAGKWLKLTGAD